MRDAFLSNRKRRFKLTQESPTAVVTRPKVALFDTTTPRFTSLHEIAKALNALPTRIAP